MPKFKTTTNAHQNLTISHVILLITLRYFFSNILYHPSHERDKSNVQGLQLVSPGPVYKIPTNILFCSMQDGNGIV